MGSKFGERISRLLVMGTAMLSKTLTSLLQEQIALTWALQKIESEANVCIQSSHHVDCYGS